jgi:hypothetical protein
MKDPGASWPALSQQLADVVFSLAQPDRQPSRTTVMAFTDELTAALIARDKELKWNVRPKWLLVSIQEILSPTGANFTKASRLRDSLKSLYVDGSKIQRITTLFIKIGEEVRGPDDLQVTKPL